MRLRPYQLLLCVVVCVIWTAGCGDDNENRRGPAPTSTSTSLPTATATLPPPTSTFTPTPTRTPTVTATWTAPPTPTPTTTTSPVQSLCTGYTNRCVEIFPGPEAQDEILTALLEAQPGDTIILRAGRYELNTQLSLDVNDVTVLGEGMDRTILSFANQTSGAEAFLVTADNFRIEDLAIEDAPGDQLKILGTRGVYIRRVRTEWTNGPDANNGAYGIYPVQCENVLIEGCVVKGASDAGIYVGQSRNIVVRGNEVQFNVAGIEIENSKDADVYENIATNNTGGILIFNLPGLPVKDGRRSRVFHNQIFENNTPNFAPPGNMVAAVPGGTGLMVMAGDQVEIFENDFRDNDTTHVLLISFRTASAVGGFQGNDPLYDPYSEGIFITDNTYEGGGTAPGGAGGAVLELTLGRPLPHIISDGDVDAAKLVNGQLPAELRTCIREPTQPTYANIDFPGGGENLTRDLSTVDCSHPRLPPVVVPFPDRGTTGVTCEEVGGRCVEIVPGENDTENLLTALLEAQPGDTIVLGEGVFDLDGQISLDVDSVSIYGQGLNRTILSAAEQIGAAEAFLVTADDFLIQDLAIEDAPGDQLKILGANGVTIRRVRAEWTNGPDSSNGAYGLYPVQCQNVLIEESVVIGASDAGIYVGQSDNIIVRRNEVRFNVAGIEIENSTDADVYENIATNNTGGILVFDLPGLPVKHGRRTRVFRNEVFSNNTMNFAPPGNIVGAVPPGTGFMLMATDQVEVFDNYFENNDTTHVLLISFRTAATAAGFQANDPEYDPYSESVFIHDNTYALGGSNPGGAAGALLRLIIGTLPLPDVIWDGDVDSAKLIAGELPPELRTCVRESNATFVNVDFANEGAGFTTDPATVDCSHNPLPEVILPGVD